MRNFYADGLATSTRCIDLWTDYYNRTKLQNCVIKRDIVRVTMYIKIEAATLDPNQLATRLVLKRTPFGKNKQAVRKPARAIK